MAQSNVSSCISAIVASYTSGIDVLKRLRRKSKCLEVYAGQHDEEARLNRSLQQGPHEIHREYILSIQSTGDEVAVGDAIAQTSLAEILLRFNTGIVQIISYFLEKDNGDIVHLDYRSLTDLSDLARLETCRVLQQLCVRLSQRGSRPLLDSRRAARDENSRRDNGSKISGHSVARVVIQGSSKPPQLMFVKPADRGRKPKPSKTYSAPNYELSGISKPVDTPPSSPPPYELYDTHAKPSRAREQHRRQPSPKLRKSRSKPSRDEVETHLPRADPTQLSAAKSMPDLHKSKSRHLKSPTSSQTNLPPPLPRPRTSHKHLKSPTSSQTHLPSPTSTPRPRTSTKNLKPPPTTQTHFPPPSPSPSPRPRPRNDRLRALRDPVPTYYSQLSDQTKLGEIPLERWPEAFDFEGMEVANREALEQGWPLNRWEEERGLEGKRRRGFWGLFRRRGVEG
ncbi:hypothetical protein KC332_g2691 [Hortaea werneckii]|nr:hypothetical protein KC348_g2592 [Hortaea werneckii]KAI7268647.1 hypothetical protein KC335_g6996 [Hortaea werneckii]KAI7416903.1 hypothetical protein KC332_g2691 [Hortaea werneckii]RMZ27374.1 hypothetical protein D0859_08555 [Hortaea werneckii]